MANTAARIPVSKASSVGPWPTPDDRATSRARPTAPPTWSVVEAMPEATPWSSAAIPDAATIHMPVHAAPWPSPSSTIPGSSRT